MTTTNNVYFVMEYCKLGDLSDYMTCIGKMDDGTISLILRQISTGMSVLQEANIVHRDLKPQNVLLSSKSMSTDFQSSSSSSRYPDVSEITLKIAGGRRGVDYVWDTGILCSQSPDSAAL